MSEENNITVAVEDLRDQLDVLWEKHLILLDRYTEAQQQLARHLSSGFFSLAQATYKSPSRIRYGQDYYDDRMQAIRRFAASPDDQELPLIQLRSDDDEIEEESKGTGNPAISSDDQPTEKHPVEGVPEPIQQQPTPPSTPSPVTLVNKESVEEDKKAKKATETNTVKKPMDPLYWYGILVPPQLRSSQKSFVAAIENPVVEAANSAQALRHISLEIRKLRKDIKKAEKVSN